MTLGTRILCCLARERARQAERHQTSSATCDCGHLGVQRPQRDAKPKATDTKHRYTVQHMHLGIQQPQRDADLCGQAPQVVEGDAQVDEAIRVHRHERLCRREEAHIQTSIRTHMDGVMVVRHAGMCTMQQLPRAACAPLFNPSQSVAHLHPPAARGRQRGGIDGQRLSEHGRRHRGAQLAGDQRLAVAKVGTQEGLWHM